MPTILCLDTEGTGLDATEDRLCEVGVILYESSDDAGRPWVRRINPGIPIPLGASAVHGIYDVDVADKPPFVEVWPELRAALEAADLLLTFNGQGHDLPLLNAERARAGLPPYQPRQHADLLLACRWLHPDLPSHRLSHLCASWLGGRAAAHDSLSDCRDLWRVYQHLLTEGWRPEDADWPAIIEALDRERSYRGWFRVGRQDGQLVLGKGKYKGVLLSEVDRGFLRWMTGLGDLPSAVRREVEQELSRSGASPVPPAAPVADSLFDSMAEAVATARKVRLTYRGEARTVQPVGLSRWGYQGWLLLAWCELRQAPRSFRLDRCGDVKVLDEQFQPAPGLSMGSFFEPERGSAPKESLPGGLPTGLRQLRHDLLDLATAAKAGTDEELLELLAKWDQRRAAGSPTTSSGAAASAVEAAP